MTTQLALSTEIDLDFLCHEWIETKTQLQQMQQHLDTVAQQLSSQLPMKTEGSNTHKVGPYTVKLTARINRSLDLNVFETVKGECPAELLPLKSSLDETKWKNLQVTHPDLAGKLKPAIKEQPGKPGVEVKV